MVTRRRGAPRLIEWTGERCVPWAPDVPVIYEHFHRYLWARAVVGPDKRVLDLGSGEGFGSALLADDAASVLGIDVAADAVEHAQVNYVAPNLEFRLGSATDLAGVADGSMDVVVAFEVIEHVADQERVLAEIDRVLAPDGFLVVSTPDRDAYALRGTEANPFHERELTLAEFQALVSSAFPTLRTFSQHVMEGSRIEEVGGTAHDARSFRIERDGDEWEVAGPTPLLYAVIVASRSALPAIPAESTLADTGLQLMRGVEREAVLAKADTADAEKRLEITRNEAIERINAAEGRAATLRQELGNADAQANVLRAERDGASAAATDMARLADDRSKDVIALQEAAVEAAGEHELELAALRLRVARVEQSVTWRAFQKTRYKVYGILGGENALAGRAVSAMLRLAGRMAPGERRRNKVRPAVEAVPVEVPVPRPETPRLTFPPFSAPVVSIVIPVHSDADVTERCLRSVLHASGQVPYEVIVVDDEADLPTKELLSRVDGIRVVVNDVNLNYLRSVNRGAAEARGRHILLLNNDTEPQLEYLDALVARMESGPDVGVVAAKLVYPDGTLQEAGGIVWRDGTAWNFGHGKDAAAPEFNYVRPVDYGSAAALLVRSEVWTALGGFDERYAPAYWEDTDLAFAARHLGWQVLYEPRALVIHHEGGSMGTDLESGGKRFQALNQPKFIEKWADALADQVPDPSHDRSGEASDRRRGPEVLVVDHRVPRPDRDSGSLRMLHILENLLELGCRVTFVPDNGMAEQPYTQRLQSMGIEVLAEVHDLNARLARLGERLSMAIVSRPYVAPRYFHAIRRYAPNAKIVYDTVDLHYLREQRRSAHEEGAENGVSEAFRHLELALVATSDVTIVVSQEEKRQLEELGATPIEVVANANVVWDAVPGPEGRAGVLFVGGFEHEPNVSAAVELAQVVMPLIWRQLPDTVLTIVGGDAPPEVLALEGEGIEVVGWVEDLDPLLSSSRVTVAPLRYGAGVKGKVTQSMGAGLPVVTTTVGAEGLGAEDGRQLFIADDPADLAARAVDLCLDGRLWLEMSEAGRQLIDDVSSPAAQRRALKRVLDR